MTTNTLRGIPVTFPYEPYSIQKDYMEKVIECLQNDLNGVLESPTGTGKTLSLLCSSLAWLTLKKAQMQAQAQTRYLEEANEFMQDLTEDLNKKTGNAPPVKAYFGIPQIIYASRTHSQLSQAMQELKRTAYSHMKACVIGSRDQLCIHPEVMNERSDKNQLCKLKLKSRSCMYYNRIEKKRDDPTIRNLSVVDIEDIVKLGKEHKFCPYYMSHELQKEADIVFMPYNYLLDPRIRNTLGLNLRNNVVILDEAHNIEKICEDSASLQIKTTDIALSIEEVTEVMKALSDTNASFADVDVPKDFEAEELCILKDMLLNFEKALDAIDIGSEGSTFEGSYIFEILGKAGINQESFGPVSALCDKVRAFLSTAGGDSPFRKRGDGLALLNDLLAIAFMKPSLSFKAKAQDCFKVHINIEEKKKSRDNWLTKVTNQQCRVLNYWCFSPGFGMNMMMDCGIKSVILTSGTLAPLSPLISELGIKISVRLENPHVISPNQICVKLLSTGPDSESLNCSYQNRGNPKYISSLGRSILNMVRLIPHGVLVFFPSYPILQKCQEHWQQEGLWSNIFSIKPIYVEPRDKEAFNSAMMEYYSKIHDPVYKGAIFMGVCRGKVSEGLDFADMNGRAVMIVGLPYPPLKDPKIILKKRYLDVCNSTNKEYLRGDDWYSLEAVRAVNQAIGRVIRHQHDYGAILLLDSRFNNYRIKSQLSLWLRDRIQLVSNFGTIVRDLKMFFQTAESIQPPPKKITMESPTKSTACSKMNCSSFSGNPTSDSSTTGLVTIHKRSPTGELENKPKKKRIVLVERAPEQRATTSNRDAEYMKLVRDTLTAEEYRTFLVALTEYRHNSSFEQLISHLDKIFSRYSVRFLLSGLACYIKAKHKTLFDEYYTKMN